MRVCGGLIMCTATNNSSTSGWGRFRSANHSPEARVGSKDAHGSQNITVTCDAGAKVSGSPKKDP